MQDLSWIQVHFIILLLFIFTPISYLPINLHPFVRSFFFVYIYIRHHKIVGTIFLIWQSRICCVFTQVEDVTGIMCCLLSKLRRKIAECRRHVWPLLE